jgi:hypothetical protein
VTTMNYPVNTPYCSSVIKYLVQFPKLFHNNVQNGSIYTWVWHKHYSYICHNVSSITLFKNEYSVCWCVILCFVLSKTLLGLIPLFSQSYELKESVHEQYYRQIGTPILAWAIKQQYNNNKLIWLSNT